MEELEHPVWTTVDAYLAFSNALAYIARASAS